MSSLPAFARRQQNDLQVLGVGFGRRLSGLWASAYLQNYKPHPDNPDNNAYERTAHNGYERPHALHCAGKYLSSRTTQGPLPQIPVPPREYPVRVLLPEHPGGDNWPPLVA